MADVGKVVLEGLKLLAAGLALIPRAVLKPFKVVMPKPLRGPIHVYAHPYSIHAQEGGLLHTCLYCRRYDQDETPYTSPPCPRSML